MQVNYSAFFALILLTFCCLICQQKKCRNNSPQNILKNYRNKFKIYKKLRYAKKNYAKE